MLYLRSLLCYVLSFSVVFTSVPISYGQSTTPRPVSCNVTSEADFRFGLESILKDVIGSSLKDVDYKGIVDKSWEKNQVNKLISTLVKRKARQLRRDKTIYQLISTLGSSEARTNFAQEFAEGVFGSEKFKEVIGIIANDVGLAISSKLDAITTKAEGPVASCIRKFIGPRYGDTIAILVSRQTQNKVGIDSTKTRSNAGVTDILAQSSGGLTGALMIVLRRAIVDRLSIWLGRRLVGTIVTRAVGAVVGIVGWVLIAKELWDLRLGILPILRKELKSDKTKAEVKAELIKGLDEELSKALDSVPTEVAASIFAIWINFKKQNEKVLELARKYPKFQNLLKELHSSDEKRALALLRKTNSLVNLTIEKGGEENFLKALNDGSLQRAILELSETGVQIAVDTKSIELAFEWTKAARDRLQDIYRIGLHKYSKPDEYDEKKIGKLLSLRNEQQMKRIAALESKKRDALFKLPQDHLQDFLENLNQYQLSALSFYIEELKPDVSQSFIRGILIEPEKMKLFSKGYVQTGILNSGDQSAAIRYMLRPNSTLNLFQLPEDIRLATNGEVHPLLLWSKEPVTLTLAAFITLFVFMTIWRLIFGRRPKIIIEQKVVDKK
ncbi:MAG: hypothetical protein ACRBBN_01890 [Methyloligellaceae bacterium]